MRFSRLFLVKSSSAPQGERRVTAGHTGLEGSHNQRQHQCCIGGLLAPMTVLPCPGASRVGSGARFAASPLSHPAPAETGCYAIKEQDCSSVLWSRSTRYEVARGSGRVLEAWHDLGLVGAAAP